MVQRFAVLPSSPGRIVEIEPSSEDMIVFIENSLGQSRITQARSDSSSSTSLKSYGIMHLARAEKVALIWPIDIPGLASLLFIPLEA